MEALQVKPSEDKVHALANSVWMVLATRLMVVLGVPLVTSIVAWSLTTTMAIDGRLIRIEQWSMDHKNIYQTTDAVRDFAARDNRLDNLDREFDKIDGRLSYVERAMPAKPPL